MHPWCFSTLSLGFSSRNVTTLRNLKSYKIKTHSHSTSIYILLPKWPRGLAAFLLFSFISVSFVLLYSFVMLRLSLCRNLLQASMSSVCSGKCFINNNAEIMCLGFPICRNSTLTVLAYLKTAGKLNMLMIVRHVEILLWKALQKCEVLS